MKSGVDKIIGLLLQLKHKQYWNQQIISEAKPDLYCESPDSNPLVSGKYIKHIFLSTSSGSHADHFGFYGTHFKISIWV